MSNGAAAERYQGKRFAGFMVVAALLALGFFFGKPGQFGVFAMYLAAAYGAYLTGQSVTDNTKAKNGNGG